MKVEIYSDGSSDGKTGGVGGWAYLVLVDGVKVHEASGSEPNATNNSMETAGAVAGLEWVVANHPTCEDVTLISDSQLVLRWASGEYKIKAPHLIPLVIRLKRAFNKLNAKTEWVKGHSGNEFNEAADKLAKAARVQL